jgi:hypothetical protein
MKLVRPAATDARWKMIVSGTDALLVMISVAVAAVITTTWTVVSILGSFTGAATVTLPVTTDNRVADGLSLGATGHATALEVTFPVLPSGPAGLLAWAGALNQVVVLVILAIVFLLAYRLRSQVLFTPRSGWIIGSGGFVLVVVGAIAQFLDGLGRSLLADLAGANGRIPGESAHFSMEFSAVPFLLGTAMLLVGGVFQFGGRLQKDTEGLV